MTNEQKSAVSWLLKKDYSYQAALMYPHTQSELSIDDTIALCDDLIAAHEGWLPQYK